MMTVPSKPSSLLSRRRRSLGQLPALATIQGRASSTQVSEVAKERTRLDLQYDMLEALGQGSTSVVKRAVRRSDGRPVALKTMRSDDPEMLTFASKEYELLRRLDHPHIICTLDLLAFTGHAIMVMDYFDGCDLMQAMQRQSGRRLPEETTRPLALALMQAVDHLHAHKVVHRDIKPQNVLVSFALDDLRLIDFNTAHSLLESQPLTPTGTVAYAAPEVIEGCSPSECSDVWSAGLCIYFMLSGLLPQRRQHDTQSRAYLQQVADETVVFEGQQWRDISDNCKAALSRALAVRPDERPDAVTLLQDPWMQLDPERWCSQKKRVSKGLLCDKAALQLSQHSANNFINGDSVSDSSSESSEVSEVSTLVDDEQLLSQWSAKLSAPATAWNNDSPATANNRKLKGWASCGMRRDLRPSADCKTILASSYPAAAVAPDLAGPSVGQVEWSAGVDGAKRSTAD